MPDGKIDRVFEPSATRRGRRQTRPVWYVTLESGERWRFRRERDALDFARRKECPNHERFCRHCHGHRVEPPELFDEQGRLVQGEQ